MPVRPMNFLEMQPPDLGEVREALSCVVGDADRAGDIIDRIREQIKKAPSRKQRFDLNAAINEVIILARSAITRMVFRSRPSCRLDWFRFMGIAFNCNKSC